LKCSNE